MPSLRTPSSLVTRMLSIPGVYTVALGSRFSAVRGLKALLPCRLRPCPTCTSRAEAARHLLSRRAEALPHFRTPSRPRAPRGPPAPPARRRPRPPAASMRIIAPAHLQKASFYDLVALAGVRAHADGARVAVGRRFLPHFLRLV